MIGREAYHHPWAMAGWDARFFGDAAARARRATRSRPRWSTTWSARLRDTASRGRIARHMIGLRNGEPGARRWRQVWSDHGLKGESARRCRAWRAPRSRRRSKRHDAELPA